MYLSEMPPPCLITRSSIKNANPPPPDFEKMICFIIRFLVFAKVEKILGKYKKLCRYCEGEDSYLFWPPPVSFGKLKIFWTNFMELYLYKYLGIIPITTKLSKQWQKSFHPSKLTKRRFSSRRTDRPKALKSCFFRPKPQTAFLQVTTRTRTVRQCTQTAFVASFATKWVCVLTLSPSTILWRKVRR